MVLRPIFFSTWLNLFVQADADKIAMCLKKNSDCWKNISQGLILELKQKWQEKNISKFQDRPNFGPLPSVKSINGPWDYAYSVFTFAVYSILVADVSHIRALYLVRVCCKSRCISLQEMFVFQTA